MERDEKLVNLVIRAKRWNYGRYVFSPFEFWIPRSESQMKRIESLGQTRPGFNGRRIFIRIVLGRPITTASSSSCFELGPRTTRHLRKLIHTWTLLHIHRPRPDNVTINFDRDPANRRSLPFNDRSCSDIHSFFRKPRLIKFIERKLFSRGRIDYSNLIIFRKICIRRSWIKSRSEDYTPLSYKARM